MDLICQPSSHHNTNQMILYAMAPFVGVSTMTGLLAREFRYFVSNFQGPKISHNSTTQMLFCAMVLIIGVLIVPGHKRFATSFLDQSYDPFNNHTHTFQRSTMQKISLCCDEFQMHNNFTQRCHPDALMCKGCFGNSLFYYEFPVPFISNQQFSADDCMCVGTLRRCIDCKETQWSSFRRHIQCWAVCFSRSSLHLN